MTTDTETLQGITADLKAETDRLLGAETTVRHDPSDPAPYSVWVDGDILGAGETLSEALDSALNQARVWAESRN